VFSGNWVAGCFKSGALRASLDVDLSRCP